MFPAYNSHVLALLVATSVFSASVASLFLHNPFTSDLAGIGNSLLDPPAQQLDPRVLPQNGAYMAVCPATPPRAALHYTNSCLSSADCRGRRGSLCCPLGRYRFCMPAVLTSTNADPLRHKPLLGIPRYCPTTEALHEFLPVKNCTNDADCEPRICCPDGDMSYCRTAVPRLEPRSSQAVRVIKNLVSYLQCTPPPPPSLDLFPKECKYSFDCFPNICCQERNKKVCRPAKKSILRLLASLSY